MAATGIDGGIDGGNATGGGGGLPSPAIPVSLFAAHVAAMDRAVQAHLGAVEVTYQPAAGSSFPVAGIFDALYVLSSTGGSLAGVETLGPAVSIVLDDVPINPELDDPTLTIGGVAYRVIGREPGGFGLMVLALRKVT